MPQKGVGKSDRSLFFCFGQLLATILSLLDVFGHVFCLSPFASQVLWQGDGLFRKGVVRFSHGKSHGNHETLIRKRPLSKYYKVLYFEETTRWNF